MSDFAKVLAGVRAGDQDAIKRLHDEFGDALRFVAKRKIKELSLGRHFDPEDLLNSAFGFICVDPSVLDEMEPYQILRYLDQMIINKAIDKRRRLNAFKRGGGKVQAQIDLQNVVDRRQAVEEEVEITEQIHLTRAKLSPLERKICMFRADGDSWQNIGDLLEISPAAAQKRYERALNRVRTEMCEG